MNNWEKFNYNLPGKFRRFLEEKVGNIKDFRLCPSPDEFDFLVFESKSTQIRVDFVINTLGMLLSIWFPEDEQNNDERDETYTEHEMFVKFDFLSV